MKAEEIADRLLADLLRSHARALTKTALHAALVAAARMGSDQGAREARGKLNEPICLLGAELAGLKGPKADRSRSYLELLRRRVSTLPDYRPSMRRRA